MKFSSLALFSSFSLPSSAHASLTHGGYPSSLERFSQPWEDPKLKLEARKQLQSFQAAQRGRQLHTEEIVEIDTYFHIVLINPDGSGDDVDEETLDMQLQVLNEAYGGMTNSFFTDCDGNTQVSYETGFRFRKAGNTTRTRYEDAAAEFNSLSEDEMKELYFITQKGPIIEDVEAYLAWSNMTNTTEQLDSLYIDNPNSGLSVAPYLVGRKVRQGDCSSLNVIIMPGNVMGAWGYSQTPWNCRASPTYSIMDSVVVHRGTLPGSNFTLPNPNACLANCMIPVEDQLQYLNEGDTLVHEVGHWLGLDHTFGGADAQNKTGCDFYAGDNILDTPAAENHGGVQNEFLPGWCTERPCCPKEKDSCPFLPGLDPVWNFMDYSDDCCMHKFSPMQAERMHYHWRLFREEYEPTTYVSMSAEPEMAQVEKSGSDPVQPKLRSEESSATSNFLAKGIAALFVGCWLLL